MKRQFVFITILLLVGYVVDAQISTMQNPRSFSLNDIELKSENTIILSSPDIDALIREDEQRANMFKPQRSAKLIHINKDFFTNAQHISLYNADLYLLKLKAQGAKALNLYSDNFFIPKGCEMYIYNPTHTKVLGAFTSDNNSKDYMFATDYVYDDEMIIEFYQPKHITEKAIINIEAVGFFYNEVRYMEQEFTEDNTYNISYKFKESGDCQVNVNCSEGDNYRKQQRSVVRMFIRMTYWDAGYCTGTLINNTANDKKPYVLSAAHCIMDVKNTNYYSQIIFYFNYESSGCNTPSYEPSTNLTMTGCNILVADTTYGISGGDYLLMQLYNPVPQSYNPYWSGWSRSSSSVNKGVCIHHPSGDIKKISTFTSPLTTQRVWDNETNSYVWNTNTHWKVKWAQTVNGYGVTEGGSSGSGLFNTKGQLIATLSGGRSSCNVSVGDKVDWYGKFYAYFTYMKQYLDPQNTNQNEINGIDYTYNFLQQAFDDNNIEIYPNPATDKLNVNTTNFKENAILSILNNIGQSVYWQEIPSGTNNYHIDISYLEKGIYYIRIYSKGESIVKKIIIQ